MGNHIVVIEHNKFQFMYINGVKQHYVVNYNIHKNLGHIGLIYLN